LIDIIGLFVESYIEDMGDTIDDIHLLFIEDDPSLVIVREHFDPHDSPLDLSFKFQMIVDTFLQHL
jgi:hypothetical protein